MIQSCNKLINFLLLAVTLVLAACGDSEPAPTSVPEATADHENDAASSEEVVKPQVHWGYVGVEGPANWGRLDAGFVLCAAGREQSPINIPANAPQMGTNLEFAYQDSAVNILNNGHTIQVNVDEGSSVTIEGEPYDLKQFHFHAGSENTLAGEQLPMEMHLVHADANGNLAVVAVMLSEGAENEAFRAVFDNFPDREAAAAPVAGVTINALDLLPSQQSYYRFDGSLTTPPCSEGVKWHVMAEPVELSAAQIAQFTAIYNNNFRPVQPMNERYFFANE